MMSATNYIEEQIPNKYPGRKSNSLEMVHIQGIIEDSSPVTALFLLKCIQVTSGSVQNGPPTRLTVYSPTPGSMEFYLEFSKKAGSAPRISLCFPRLSLQGQKVDPWHLC